MTCCGCHEPITGPHTTYHGNGLPAHWVCLREARRWDEMDDAIHIAAPDPSMSLCGLPNRRNLAPLSERPTIDGMSGCWSCLIEADRNEARP